MSEKIKEFLNELHESEKKEESIVSTNQPFKSLQKELRCPYCGNADPSKMRSDKKSHNTVITCENCEKAIKNGNRDDVARIDKAKCSVKDKKVSLSKDLYCIGCKNKDITKMTVVYKTKNRVIRCDVCGRAIKNGTITEADKISKAKASTKV